MATAATAPSEIILRPNILRRPIFLTGWGETTDRAIQLSSPRRHPAGGYVMELPSTAAQKFVAVRSSRARSCKLTLRKGLTARPQRFLEKNAI